MSKQDNTTCKTIMFNQSTPLDVSAMLNYDTIFYSYTFITKNTLVRIWGGY